MEGVRETQLQMEQEGVEVSSQVYSSRIAAAQTIEEARVIFGEADATDKCDLSVFSAMEAALRRKGDMEGSQLLRKVIRETGFHPSAHAASADVRCADTLEEALNRFRDAERAGVANKSVYTALESAQRRFGRPQDAARTRELVNELQYQSSNCTEKNPVTKFFSNGTKKDNGSKDSGSGSSGNTDREPVPASTQTQWTQALRSAESPSAVRIIQDMAIQREEDDARFWEAATDVLTALNDTDGAARAQLLYTQRCQEQGSRRESPETGSSGSGGSGSGTRSGGASGGTNSGSSHERVVRPADSPMATEVISYATDTGGLINCVETTKQWAKFLDQNATPSTKKSCCADSVVGKPLFGYMTPFFRGLYEAMNNALMTKKARFLSFTYFCDAPKVRRQMMMTAKSDVVDKTGAVGGIVWSSITVHEFPSDAPMLSNIEESEGGVPHCGWCQCFLKSKRWVTPSKYTSAVYSHPKRAPKKLGVTLTACPSCIQSFQVNTALVSVFESSPLSNLLSNAPILPSLVIIDSDPSTIEHLEDLTKRLGWSAVVCDPEDALTLVGKIAAAPVAPPDSMRSRFLSRIITSCPRAAAAALVAYRGNSSQVIGLADEDDEELCRKLGEYAGAWIPRKCSLPRLQDVLAEYSRDPPPLGEPDNDDEDEVPMLARPLAIEDIPSPALGPQAAVIARAQPAARPQHAAAVVFATQPPRAQIATQSTPPTAGVVPVVASVAPGQMRPVPQVQVAQVAVAQVPQQGQVMPVAPVPQFYQPNQGRQAFAGVPTMVQCYQPGAFNGGTSNYMPVNQVPIQMMSHVPMVQQGCPPMVQQGCPPVFC